MITFTYLQLFLALLGALALGSLGGATAVILIAMAGYDSDRGSSE